MRSWVLGKTEIYTVGAAISRPFLLRCFCGRQIAAPTIDPEIKTSLTNHTAQSVPVFSLPRSALYPDMQKKQKSGKTISFAFISKHRKNIFVNLILKCGPISAVCSLTEARADATIIIGKVCGAVLRVPRIRRGAP